jgi:hypothetical protein
MEPARKRARGGGNRQRARGEYIEQCSDATARSGVRPPTEGSSAIGLLLTTLWIDAVLSPQLCQKLAKAVDADIDRLVKWNTAYMFTDDMQVRSTEMHTYPDIFNISKIGDFGRISSNCNRDFVRQLPPCNIDIHEPFLMSLKKFGTIAWHEVMQWMLLPHLLFSNLYHDYKAGWDRFICPPGSNTTWWDGFAHSPQMAHPDLRTRRNLRTHGVGLRLHGDGVATVGAGKSWCKMADVFSWSSVHGAGATKQKMYFIWSIFEHLISRVLGHNTMEEFSEILKWSLEQLWTGEFDKKDWKGRLFRRGTLGYRMAHVRKLLADGFFGVVVIIQSDIDFLNTFWKFPRPGSVSPCAFCPCNNAVADVLWWANFCIDPSAPWMTQIHSVAHFAGMLGIVHTLFGARGMSPLTVCVDWMHTKYLGTDLYLAGSVLFVMVHHLLPGTLDENLAAVWDQIQIKYGEHKVKSQVRIRVLKHTMFNTGSGGYPCFKSKAAAVKHLMPVLLEVFREGMTAGDPYHDGIENALETSCKMDQILDANRGQLFLPPADSLELFTTCLAHVQQVGQLKNHNGIRVFHLTFKAHWLLHAAYNSRYYHPALGWCFMGEDYMKYCRRWHCSSAPGVKSHLVHKKALDKITMALHHALS